MSEACEYNDAWEHDHCFGKRPKDTWVWVIGPAGRSWHVWDLMTGSQGLGGPAFVACDVLEVTFAAPRCGDPPPPPERRRTVTCIDRSASYGLLERALRGLDELTWRTHRPGYEYFFRWIDGNPAAPQAQLMAPILIPTIGPPLATPSVPVPATSTPNPTYVVECARSGQFPRPECGFLTRTATPAALELQQRVEAFEAAQAAYRTAEAARLDAPAAYLEQRLKELSASRPTRDARADIGGCINEAAGLLAGAAGGRPVQKYLFIAARLDAADPPPAEVKPLEHVLVRFVYVECHDAAVCTQRRADWRRVLAAAGVGDTVRFVPPDEDPPMIALQ